MNRVERFIIKAGCRNHNRYVENVTLGPTLDLRPLFTSDRIDAYRFSDIPTANRYATALSKDYGPYTVEVDFDAL